MDLSNHALVPLDHLIELESSAYNSPPLTIAQHGASTVKNTMFFAAAGLAFTGACWGWAKAMDYLEEKQFQRTQREKQAAGLS